MSELPPGSELSNCRGESCGAEILWVRTMAGAWMPLEVKPVRVIVKVRGDVGDPRYRSSMAWVPHWASCPDRRRFRRDAVDGHLVAKEVRHEAYANTSPQPPLLSPTQRADNALIGDEGGGEENDQ